MLHPLKTDLLVRRLQNRWLGKPFHYFPELPSTNTWLKEARQQYETGTVIFTDHQTHGRGQRSKAWISAPNSNLTFSALLRPGNPRYVHSLTLVAALAICETIAPLINKPPAIKWPNDILVQNRKVAGILVEASFMGPSVDQLILGIGLNVNQTAFSDNLLPATSVRLDSETKSPISREELLVSLLNALEQKIEAWEVRPDSIRADVNRLLVGFGKYGRIEAGGELLPGVHKFMGINADGFPVFVDVNAEITTFTSTQVRFHPS